MPLTFLDLDTHFSTLLCSQSLALVSILLMPERSRFSKHICVTLYNGLPSSRSRFTPEKLEMGKCRQHLPVPPCPFPSHPWNCSINSHFLSIISTSPSPSSEVYFRPPCLCFPAQALIYFPSLMPDSTRSSKHIYTKVSNSPSLTLENNAVR